MQSCFWVNGMTILPILKIIFMTSDELVSDKNATMLLGKWNDHLAHSQDQIMGVKWGVYSNKFQGRE